MGIDANAIRLSVGFERTWGSRLARLVLYGVAVIGASCCLGYPLALLTMSALPLLGDGTWLLGLVVVAAVLPVAAGIGYVGLMLALFLRRGAWLDGTRLTVRKLRSRSIDIATAQSVAVRQAYDPIVAVPVFGVWVAQPSGPVTELVITGPEGTVELRLTSMERMAAQRPTDATGRGGVGQSGAGRARGGGLAPADRRRAPCILTATVRSSTRRAGILHSAVTGGGGLPQSTVVRIDADQSRLAVGYENGGVAGTGYLFGFFLLGAMCCVCSVPYVLLDHAMAFLDYPSTVANEPSLVMAGVALPAIVTVVLLGLMTVVRLRPAAWLNGTWLTVRRVRSRSIDIATAETVALRPTTEQLAGARPVRGWAWPSDCVPQLVVTGPEGTVKLRLASMERVLLPGDQLARLAEAVSESRAEGAPEVAAWLRETSALPRGS